MTSLTHVHRMGDGAQTLVCLHGWAGDGRLFKDVADVLADEALVLAPDMPGYGASEPPTRWSRASIVDALDAALRPEVQARSGPLTLVGTCSGAVFAMELAKRWQLNDGPVIHRLLLFESFSSMPWYFRIFLAPFVGRVLYTLVFQNGVGRWVTELFLRGRSSTAANDLGRIPASLTLSYLRLMAEVAPTDYQPLRMPIHLVAGSHTFKAIHHALSVWQGQWPAATRTVVPGGTHLLVDERPEVVAEFVRAASPPLLESSHASLDCLGESVADAHGLAST